MMKKQMTAVWPKFKRTQFDRVTGRYTDRIVERSEAVEEMGEETIVSLEQASFIAIQHMGIHEPSYRLYTMADGIRDAAPDLLDALRRVEKNLEEGFRNVALEEARAAILKATGGSK